MLTLFLNPSISNIFHWRKFVKAFLTNIRVHLIAPGKLDFEAWWIKKKWERIKFWIAFDFSKTRKCSFSHLFWIFFNVGTSVKTFFINFRVHLIASTYAPSPDRTERFSGKEWWGKNGGKNYILRKLAKSSPKGDP